MNHPLTSAHLLSELKFTTTRSSGPGGQNVNKVNSKVVVTFDVSHSVILSQEQKTILVEKLGSHLTKNGVLIVSSQSMRSQLQNREDALRKLDSLLLRALTPRKKRKRTKPSATARAKRLKEKKHASRRKENRNKSWTNSD